MSEKATELHLTYGVPEPIVAHVGTERSSIHLSPMADEMGRHVIKIFDNTGADRNQYVGSVRLEPDPAAEAEQKVLERLLRRACAVVGDVLRNNGVAPNLASTAASAVRDALDATPEPVSEYERGAKDMKAKLIPMVEAHRRDDRPFNALLRDLSGVSTEPTDAK